MLWTYAEHHDDGSYKRVGGGTYDADTDTYGQGAFNADDIARAAVVYLRDWRQTGHASSRRQAFQLLRGLTYLQTASGPNAGNVVLWMQPDGTLNPSADPRGGPGPLRQRTVLLAGSHHLGAGRGLRGVPRSRTRRSRGSSRTAWTSRSRRSTDRCSTSYGTYKDIDGRRTPRGSSSTARTPRPRRCSAWPPTTAAGGTPEGAPRDAAARPTASRRWPAATRGGGRSVACCRGRSRARTGTPGPRRCRPRWPGPGGCSATARCPDGARDSFTFDPWLLTSGGPDNGRLPTRVDSSQIAYGVDSRVQSLVATRAEVPPGWPAGRRMVLRRQRLPRSRRTTPRPGSPSTASPATAP